jgi:hypothetical protein
LSIAVHIRLTPAFRLRKLLPFIHMALHKDNELLNAIDIQHTSDHRLCIGMSIIITSVCYLVWHGFDFELILVWKWRRQWKMKLTHCKTSNNKLISMMSIVTHSSCIPLQACSYSCMDLF